jgi:urate oxidase
MSSGVCLAQNRYGKAENRVFRLNRNGDFHDILDLNVTVQLCGDFEAMHLTGSNAACVATDSQKNTVFVMAQKLGGGAAMAPEAFALALGKHFLTTYPHITRAEIGVEKYEWERIKVGTVPQPRAFKRSGSHVRTAKAVVDRRGEGSASLSAFVCSGIENLIILKSGDSEFKGYIKDQFTTLKESSDRIMATEMSASWRMSCDDVDSLLQQRWDEQFEQNMAQLLGAWAVHYSLSLQQTLYAMASALLQHQPGVAAVRLSLPNKHHFPVDMAPFGLPNDNSTFIAADRPYGLIEAVVNRQGATQPPADLWPSWGLPRKTAAVKSRL